MGGWGLVLGLKCTHEAVFNRGYKQVGKRGDHACAQGNPRGLPVVVVVKHKGFMFQYELEKFPQELTVIAR